MPRNVIDAVQGTLETLILKSLLMEERHGYGVARWIFSTSGEDLRIEEGTLYPALHRMEERGWIDAHWGISENNRRAKYYRITAAGRAELEVRVTEWRRYARAMNRILEAAPRGA